MYHGGVVQDIRQTFNLYLMSKSVEAYQIKRIFITTHNEIPKICHYRFDWDNFF